MPDFVMHNYTYLIKKPAKSFDWQAKIGAGSENRTRTLTLAR